MKVWQKIVGQIFAFLGMCFLGTEAYLRLFAQKSLCTTKTCAIVGHYVRIGEVTIVALGFIFFALLWLSLFFYFRYFKDWLNKFIIFSLSLALAFDGALIGFQFFVLGKECQLCFAVAGLLLLSALGYSVSRKKTFSAALFLGIWLSAFSAFYVLDFPKPPPPLAALHLLKLTPAKTGKTPQFYLFVSLHCGHCSRLIANLAINPKIALVPWKIFIVDSKKEDLKRISYLLTDKQAKKNPFLEILRLETGKVAKKIIEQQKIPPELEKNISKIQNYFKGHRFIGVPLLIVEEEGQRLILTGTNHILAYLRQIKLVDREVIFKHK
ncbi:MAG: hypothetical protein Q9M37_05885 [Desulfonauticus sp.]|nr:hypothetical protein [Desulfonauticus sp.]